MCYIQRSRGYAARPALSLEQIEAISRAAKAAVSYTHLDVYKRQVPRLAAARNGAVLRLQYDFCTQKP